MRTTTTSIFRFIAVLVLIASTLVSSALADYVEVSSYWAVNRGASISVNQGASPDLLVFVSSDAEFRLWIDVIRGRSVVRNVVSNVPVMAGVGNPYLHTFPIPTAGLGGDYIIRVQVRNGVAFDDSFVNLHVATAPVMNSVPVQPPMNEGESRTIQVSGFDLDGDSISLEASERHCMMGRLCFARALPAEATFTDRGDGTGFLQFQPGFDFVIHPDRAEDITFQFRAYDGNRRTGWQAATITVNDVNRIPQIISVPVTNAQEGTFYEYIITATDADPEDRLSYSLVESPAGMTITRSRVEWTPTYDQAGDHDVTVAVSDSIDAVRQSYTITVANFNRAPVLGPLQDYVINEGEQLVFTVTVSDPDGDVVVISANNVPPGAVFVDSGMGTAQFAWVPNSEQSGEYDIFIYATDGASIVRGRVHITVLDVTVVCADGDNIAGRECVCQVPLADVNGICRVPLIPVPGCMDPTALNFNPLATVDDGNCTYPVPQVPGCTDPAALNFNPAANVDDGSCYPPTPVPGCTDSAALNFNPNATSDDGSCRFPPESVLGCTDPAALNFNPAATVDDGNCTYPPVPVPGCTDPAALNFNPNATSNDGSCAYLVPNITGCTDPAALNYNLTANVDDGSCMYPVPSILGCTDPAASNYDPTATDNRGCVYFPASGCTDPNALNYDRRVRTDDGSCEYMRRGLVILSVHPSEEVASAGEMVQFNVDVKNYASTAANDLQLRVLLYDLSEVGYSREFNLRPGRSSSQAAVLQIPYGAWPGRYVVQITVDNGQWRDTAYRELTIN